VWSPAIICFAAIEVMLFYVRWCLLEEDRIELLFQTLSKIIVVILEAILI